MNIPQFLKISFTINGHLGCFQVLAITNSAAVNVLCQSPPAECTHFQYLELTKMEAFLLFWYRSHGISLRFELAFPSVLMGSVQFMFVDQLDFSLL